MHRGASTGNSALCELLIEEGAEVDATDKAGQTPLMNAVICHNKEVISVKFIKVVIGTRRAFLCLMIKFHLCMFSSFF